MSDVRRLENEDEEKFWEAWIKDDLIFCYRYGKLGSNGHTKLKKFKTRAEAEAELEQKLQEKLDEGFAEPGAEEAEEAEEDGEAAEEETATDADEEAEAEEDGDDGDDGDDEEDDEDADDDEEADDEDDEDAENEDEQDDEERPRRGARPRAQPPRREPKPPPPPPPPEPPRLPARFVSTAAAPAAVVDHATDALQALKKAVGGRSFILTRRGLAARRAFERLGGIDPMAVPALAGPFGELMSLVLAPRPRLPLHVALGLLWEVDAAAFARVVAGWRAKMLSSPAEAAIGILGATFDAVPDAEVAVHAGAVLVDRRLPAAAWARRYGKVRPFLAASLEKKGHSVGAFLRTLRPGADPIIRARLADALREEDVAS